MRIEGFLVGEIDPEQCRATTQRYALHTTLYAHGKEEGTPYYDVYIDGYGGEQYEFESGWQLAFDRAGRLRC
ncbi:MAG TPA: hypothetical protein VLK37_05240 [Solirubrobacterales bacterium]|nr:hypothetical protein [Solirubrobacterales bacterium]